MKRQYLRLTFIFSFFHCSLFISASSERLVQADNSLHTVESVGYLGGLCTEVRLLSRQNFQIR